MLLEGFAIEQLSVLAEDFRADLLSTIYKRVRRDEARHVAFGMAFIRDEVQRRCVHPSDFRQRADELNLHIDAAFSPVTPDFSSSSASRRTERGDVSKCLG